MAEEWSNVAVIVSAAPSGGPSSSSQHASPTGQNAPNTFQRTNSRGVVVAAGDPSSTTTTNPSRQGNNGVVVVVAGDIGGGTDLARGIVQPFTSTKRQLMVATSDAASAAAYSANNSVASYLHALVDSNASLDVARTYWKPNKLQNETGLMETLHLRADNRVMNLLVSSRPAEELRRNFSTTKGDCIRLDDDLFKLSRTNMALRAMEHRVDDTITVDGHTIKSAMREHLLQLHQDDYYLVTYRDYSDWAIKHHKERAVRDTTLGPKYVEQCFAVCVGQNAGAFIPITHAQFHFGCEVLEQQRHKATPAQIASKAINLFALNGDQFRSLSTVSSPLGATNTTTTTSPSHATAAAAANNHQQYVAPSPWDWTPVAIERRITHFMDQQYRAVGRLVIKGLLTAFCLYMFVSFVQQGRRSSSLQQNSNDQRRSARRSQRSSNGSRYDSSEGGSAVGNVLYSVCIAGPKEAFDFIFGWM